MQNSKKLNNFSISIDINHMSNLWSDNTIDIESLFNTVIKEILKNIDVPDCFHSELELSVVLCDDNYMKDLNYQYMNKNKPTNVLSFPLMNGYECDNELYALGDIVFSFETIKNEANDQSKTFENHLTHLFIHGFLHLLGFDHVKDQDALVMEQLEIEILEDLGIKNPYQ
jgi:probable rRNA maturation factor